MSNALMITTRTLLPFVDYCIVAILAAMGNFETVYGLKFPVLQSITIMWCDD